MKRLASFAALAALVLTTSSARAEIFILHIHETPEAIATRTDAQKGPAHRGAYAVFGDKLQAAGVIRDGGAFKTGEAVRTVQIRRGETTDRSYLRTAIPG